MERRIYQQKDGKLNEADRQLLASLLLKCGYTVKIGKERKDGKNIYTFFIAYEGDEK